MSKTRLYLITPSTFNLNKFAGSLTEALEGGDVASVQLRMKESNDEDIIEAAKVLMPICHAKDVAFIINDNADIAKIVGADGVHIGQEDPTLEEVRTIIGVNKVIGVTCKDSKHISMTAGEQGADYVAFGAFFPTKTKSMGTTASPEILQWWQDIFEIPCVAIGGINSSNASSIAKAGADFVAVCSGVWDHPDGPKIAVTEINEAINT